MHGRPRKPLKPEDAAASAAKAEKLRVLQSQFLHNHHNHIYSKEAVELSTKLLETNPELYTAWNYRKLAVQHKLTENDSDPDSLKSILDEELRVVESALRQNFKSYGAWHHRKWILSKGHSSIDNELRLLDKFQKADSRNFHAWNYRRFVAASMNRSEEDELKYTEDMICNNFSNYSAWHNRSLLLSNLLKRKVEGFVSKEKVLPDEYEFVHQAIFTDPDDQSGWFYHLWLLDQTVRVDSPQLVSSWPTPGSDLILLGDRCLDGCASSPFTRFHLDSRTFPLVLYFNQAVEGVNSSTITVDSELNTNKDLVWKPLSSCNSKAAQVWVTQLNLPDGNTHSSKVFPVEDSSPISSLYQLSIKNDNELTDFEWRAATIAKEIDHFRELLSLINCKIGKLTLARLLMAHDAMMCPPANKISHSEEVLELYNDLMRLDPTHVQYYKDQHSLVLLQQVTSNWESLLSRCFHYSNSPSNRGSPMCLQLKNLSLSRLGSFDKLLWVQMLDLSHNELRSIEGLEALQLLSCLNLSNNILGSFTALEPIRQLKSLRALNISYNEIGAHSIDTTKYLCSSPLSHSVGSEWNHGQTVIDDDIKSYWEAYFILKGLNLTQFDIVGNAIVNEKFKSFLIKVLPGLKWLDGEQLH
ncbi:Geranylgeranyl transferase type-2 subunit alpha 1 [Citrus sinensis]|uniref:Geranylgeranyl transferase type-2 subunit alpha 1 n=1 Tax=Citrus sinensis TaxID=2711 RepID=A0ACB8KP01_CITSI|nr:Geranylgeranyl transferase type-2 subunit alpha 1 [Citrus sinensis]